MKLCRLFNSKHQAIFYIPWDQQIQQVLNKYLNIYCWRYRHGKSYPREKKFKMIQENLHLAASSIRGYSSDEFAEYSPKLTYGKTNITESWETQYTCLEQSKRRLLTAGTAGTDQPLRTQLSFSTQIWKLIKYFIF